MGYLAKYKALVDTVNNAADPNKVRAELSILLNKFDPGELFQFEQAHAHSVSLLQTWLPAHKFSGWALTRTTNTPVTDDMRRKRAGDIAKILSDPERWHSHGRGIGIKELTSEELKLDILNFGDDAELNNHVRSYYSLFTDYCGKIGCSGTEHAVIHSALGMRKV